MDCSNNSICSFENLNAGLLDISIWNNQITHVSKDNLYYNKILSQLTEEQRKNIEETTEFNEFINQN